MPFIARLWFLIPIAVLAMSCASRPPAVVNKETVPLMTVPVTAPEEILSAEPKEPFERALWNVKMNTSLIRKYFENGESGISGPGIIDVENIVIKGECQIDGMEFIVSYDLVNAVEAGKNVFCIPFFLENPATGVSCFDELFWNPVEDEAGILLSFDDNYWHTWRTYFDLFDSYEAKVTFFIQGSLPSYLGDGINSLASSEETSLIDFCLEARNRGHDLGFHSMSHYDLTKVSRKTFRAETIEAAKTFNKAGIPFSAFAFPFGFSQPWMQEELAPFFLSTRGYGTNIRFYDFETIANRYLISKAIDNIVYPDDVKFENDLFRMLFAVKFSGNHIVPFTTHDISDTVRWGIKPGRLEFLLKTAQELKLKFYTYNYTGFTNLIR